MHWLKCLVERRFGWIFGSVFDRLDGGRVGDGKDLLIKNLTGWSSGGTVSA